jgi:hypothetical protein
MAFYGSKSMWRGRFALYLSVITLVLFPHMLKSKGYVREDLISVPYPRDVVYTAELCRGFSNAETTGGLCLAESEGRAGLEGNENTAP